MSVRLSNSKVDLIGNYGFVFPSIRYGQQAEIYRL